MNTSFEPKTLEPKRHASQEESQSAISYPSRTIVHAKLEMTSPGDRDEQEADAVANEVVSGGKIARKISGGGGSSGIAVPSQMESRLLQQQGGGQPMPSDLRSKMESSFDRKFSHVRLHTDLEAARLSDNIRAKAFTLGNDIYFNQGKFTPDTNEGQRLVAHELTHVLQRTGKVASQEETNEVKDTEEQNTETNLEFDWHGCRFVCLTRLQEGKRIVYLEQHGGLRAFDEVWITVRYSSFNLVNKTKRNVKMREEEYHIDKDNQVIEPIQVFEIDDPNRAYELSYISSEISKKTYDAEINTPPELNLTREPDLSKIRMPIGYSGDGEPLNIKIEQGFNGGFSHANTNAIDISSASSSSIPVVAVDSGLVIKAIRGVTDNNTEGQTDPKAGGNRVYILHTSQNSPIYGYISEYCHLEDDTNSSIKIPQLGSFMQSGQQIGIMGNTGYSKGRHLHFAIVRFNRQKYTLDNTDWRFDGVDYMGETANGRQRGIRNKMGTVNAEGKTEWDGE